MLENIDAVAVLPVKDLVSARKYYQETLGLKEEEESLGGVMFRSGNSKIFVYETKEAGTNKATALSWVVKDLRAVVDELKSKGVKFERYDMPDVEVEDSIHKMGDMESAWFVDPFGNIFSIAKFV